MINFLKGTVFTSNEQSITLMLNQIGIGFEIFITKKVQVSIGKEISLFIYSHWNQEHGPTLYGFLNENEKKIFELILSCSGIGPKIGLALLSQIEPQEFIRSITDQDVKLLSSVNGIGTKKAEQIIMQLKHKISSFLDTGFCQDSESYKHLKSVNEVLTSLNYSRSEIVTTIEHLKNNCSLENYTFDQLLRQALSILSKKL